MMANQCRTEMRWARPPDGLLSGTFEDMIHTVIAAARQHWQLVGRHQERPPKRELRFRPAIRDAPAPIPLGPYWARAQIRNLKNIL
jgi:hypothetical protein